MCPLNSLSYPSKLYYSISEVAKIVGVKAHVLRYWETEFSTLHPRKTRTGSRRYRQVDIDEVLAIKNLLYEEGFKIAGAKKMRRQAKQQARHTETEMAPQLDLGFSGIGNSEQKELIKGELRDILDMIRQLGHEFNKTEAPTQPKEMEGKA